MHGKKTIEKYKQLAIEKKLLITGGSDCHGTVKPKEYIGKIKLDKKFLKGCWLLKINIKCFKAT